MTTKKRIEIKHDYQTELQLRNGVPTAIISIEKIAVHYDGRGFSHQSTEDRQVLVLPLHSLGNLIANITDTLTYDLTADPNEKYDLTNEAMPRIGLYDSHAFGSETKPKLLLTYYTLTEARWATQAVKGKGYTLRHLDDAESGDPVKFATSVIETV